MVNSPLRLKELLPGSLHEHVQVTPRGSRAHTLTHKSPGGTIRIDQRTSPPGSPQPEQERGAWRLHIAAQRRKASAERAAEAESELEDDVDERDVHRYMRHKRCGACQTCVELSRFGGTKHRASAPCDTVLSRLKYTESERANVCDPTQRFARC